MKDTRSLNKIPRSVTTIATVIGGVIGIILSQYFGWNFIEGLVYTIIIIVLCLFIAVGAVMFWQKRQHQS